MLFRSNLVGHPTYWIRPFAKVRSTIGHHRIYWDLRYSDPVGTDRGFAISAVYRNTPSGPQGPYVHPGVYKVRLTVDGKSTEKPISVRLDPRVSISDADLRLQTDLSMTAYDSYHQLQAIRDEIDKMKEGPKKWKKGQFDAVVALRGAGDPDGGDFLYGSITETTLEKETVVSLQHKMLFLVNVLQSADAAPTSQMKEAIGKLTQRAKDIAAAWAVLKK